MSRALDPQKPPERELRRQIKDALQAKGFLVLYLEESKGYGRPGTPGLPDLVAIRKGEYVWIEVKSLTGQLQAAQADLHRLMRAAGANVIVARSTDDVRDL